MMNDETLRQEASRLERLWSGDFGDDYSVRNDQPFENRKQFWNDILALTDPSTVLEVGCNAGGNLRWLASPNREVWGLDINARALELVNERYPDIRTVLGPARALPFNDDEFELVLTAGVLIHQPSESLLDVMSEMVRCSSRYVLASEYHANDVEEIEYRGIEGALFKRDYGAIFEHGFGLSLLRSGFLSKVKTGWDNVTWWLFEKSA